MLDDIAKVDRVHKPETLKTSRDRDTRKRGKDEHSPPPKEPDAGTTGSDEGPEHLLDVRI
jgi:hypothetical protein